jgi:hypothetical protein
MRASKPRIERGVRGKDRRRRGDNVRRRPSRPRCSGQLSAGSPHPGAALLLVVAVVGLQILLGIVENLEMVR